jgi:alpha-tubulin suppressor-like RCC1 family protein
MSSLPPAWFWFSVFVSFPGFAMAQATSTQVASGGKHSCARIDDGSVRCWGENRFGQLGDGTTTDRATPVTVSDISNAASIALGENYSCAVLSDGTARCWGQNNDAQLGDGTELRSSVPVTVSGLSHATALAAGVSHTCALIDDGSVRCWGMNGDGQLGDSSTDDKLSPVPVPGITGATAVAVGESHSCALLSNHSVRCWGWNGYGQLGDPSVALRSRVPVTVTGLSDARAIAAGLDHACAALGAGSVVCWGYNASGGLGDGTTTHRSTPTMVVDLAGAEDVSAGFDHSCARLTSGALKCWGTDQSGELGDTNTGVNSDNPVTVDSLPGSAAGNVGAGSAHTCALIASVGVYCWGSNSSGQLGIGTEFDSVTPALVVGLAFAAPTGAPAIGGVSLAALMLSLLALGFLAVRRRGVEHGTAPPRAVS